MKSLGVVTLKKVSFTPIPVAHFGKCNCKCFTEYLNAEVFKPRSSGNGEDERALVW